MARLLALNAIFFMVPFAVYAGWLYATRRSLGTNDWPTRVIIILCSIGALFVVIGLVVLTETESTSTTGGTYIPADIQDGEIVPGRFSSD